MQRLAASLLIAGALLSTGCAARSSGPARPNKVVQQPTQNSRWREMTWAEYYSDVVERARKRGVMLIWVQPPRPEKPSDQRAAKP